MTTMGERVRKKRKELGFTQEDLSGPNFSHAVISLIERDRANPSLKTLEYIAEKLNVNVNYLLYGQEKQIDVSNDITSKLAIIPSLLKLTKFKEAKKAINEINEESVNTDQLGEYIKLKGDIEVGLGNYSEAVSHYKNALIYTTLLNIETLIEVYTKISDCFINLKDYQLAIENAQQGLLLFRFYQSKVNPFTKLQLYYNLSLSYCRISEFKKGLQSISTAFAYMEETHCYYFQNLFCMLEGLAYLYTSKFKEGIKSTLMAIKHMEKSNSTELIGCYTNLGILYREIRDYKKSLVNLEKSLELSIMHNNSWNLLNTNLEIALTYFLIGDYKSSEIICQKQLENTNNRSELFVKITLLLAFIKFKSHSNEEALELVIEAEKLSKAKGGYGLLSKIFILKSKIFNAQGKHQEAINALNTALNYCKGESYDNLSFFLE
ncbi:helix-turn-helix domain-containing protein [Cytobacillus firmus]|uniref:helix-turn-helix domain-containing protein n=1 Tax=Cytobacillus firmus TaxID=1399 RepID=UPI00207A1DC3|nr:helix-turn-helix transcriptional regulator [Cytobacillus firmus]USK37082.1 helix-turn-helix domain-containing protein [Cytobacillus firmus]